MRTGVFYTLFSFLVLTHTAPNGKLFHEHVEDFFGLILAESGLRLELLLKQYGESKEFGVAANYLRTTSFKDVLQQVESLPEFKAVIEYLEQSHINVSHILEHINELVEHNEKTDVEPRKHKQGEMDMSAFIQESIRLLPREKLAQLFEKKQKDYPTFRDSMEKFKTEEWDRLYRSLLESHEFKKAESTLADNGLDVRLFIEQIKALFGQN